MKFQRKSSSLALRYGVLATCFPSKSYCKKPSEVGQGISIYGQGLDKSLQGEVFALGFNMTTNDCWKSLVVHRGSLENTGAFTAVSGTMFHTINTEYGWSGSPFMRMVNGNPVVPGPAAYNIAITAPMVEKLVRCHDNDSVATWNPCGFHSLWAPPHGFRPSGF